MGKITDSVRKFQNNLSYSYRTRVTEETGDKVTVILKTGEQIEILFKWLADYIERNRQHIFTYVIQKPIL